MARKVTKVWTEKRKNKSTGKLYTLYFVELEDGDHIYTSVTPYKVGDMAQSWFDDKYNMIKLKKITK